MPFSVLWDNCFGDDLFNSFYRKTLKPQKTVLSNHEDFPPLRQILQIIDCDPHPAALYREGRGFGSLIKQSKSFYFFFSTALEK